MSSTTAILGLIKHVDGDSVRAGETTDASANMDAIDALFHATTGHKHTGAGTNGPKILATSADVTGLTAAKYVRVNAAGTALETADVPNAALAAEVTTPIGNATSHIAAVAAVHGLGANVNALGNRNISGEYIQRGSSANTYTKSAKSLYADESGSHAVTYPVAFASTPLVFLTAVDGHAAFATAYEPSTTGFKILIGSTANANATVNWLAVGA